MQTTVMNKLTLPNLLSGLRLILSLPSAWFTWQENWPVAGALFVTAVVTDMIDGRLARRFNQVTLLGGVLDHGSDAIYVTATLAGLAALGIVPALLPLLIIVAFSQYVLDSRTLAGRPLRASLLGRYNGIAYFVLAGFPVGQEALQFHLLPTGWFMWFGWALVLTTVISIIDRLMALMKLRLSR